MKRVGQERCDSRLRVMLIPRLHLNFPPEKKEKKKKKKRKKQRRKGEKRKERKKWEECAYLVRSLTTL